MLDRARALALALAVGLPVGGAAQTQDKGDVFDQFFRYSEQTHRATIAASAEETVDPFTGTLTITQQDLVLPGKAGLDLRIIRSYSSKLWGRVDLLDTEPLLAEKEHSVLGYGWSLHLARLRNPYLSRPWDTAVCSGEFPVFEAEDGSSKVFYPTIGTNSDLFISRDHWLLDRNCATAMGQGACVMSTSGVRYEFPRDDPEYQFWIGTTPVYVVSTISDPFRNAITARYLPGTGAVKQVTDTYLRTIEFHYSCADGSEATESHPCAGDDGLRLTEMNANGNKYTYGYATYDAYMTFGAGRMALPGSRRFLTVVQPPAGRATYYEYGYTAAVANNQYALTAITYPNGGRSTYTYDTQAFFTGSEQVSFAVVKRRLVEPCPDGRGCSASAASGTWDYSYTIPTPGNTGTNTVSGLPADLNVTDVTRPDGRHDTYTMYGFAWAADNSIAQGNRGGFSWPVGLTVEVARGDRQEVELFGWEHGQAISRAVYSGPMYSKCAGPLIADGAVYAPVTVQRQLIRDGQLFLTQYSDLDTYGQPGRITETGNDSRLDYVGGGSPPALTRTTVRSYSYVPAYNMVLGRPATQRVCTDGTDCSLPCFDHSICVEDAGPTTGRTRTVLGSPATARPAAA